MVVSIIQILNKSKNVLPLLLFSTFVLLTMESDSRLLTPESASRIAQLSKKEDKHVSILPMKSVDCQKVFNFKKGLDKGVHPSVLFPANLLITPYEDVLIGYNGKVFSISKKVFTNKRVGPKHLLEHSKVTHAPLLAAAQGKLIVSAGNYNDGQERKAEIIFYNVMERSFGIQKCDQPIQSISMDTCAKWLLVAHLNAFKIFDLRDKSLEPKSFPYLTISRDRISQTDITPKGEEAVFTGTNEGQMRFFSDCGKGLSYLRKHTTGNNKIKSIRYLNTESIVYATTDGCIKRINVLGELEEELDVRKFSQKKSDSLQEVVFDSSDQLGIALWESSGEKQNKIKIIKKGQNKELEELVLECPIEDEYDFWSGKGPKESAPGHIIDVALHGEHVVALGTDGNLYLWGFSQNKNAQEASCEYSSEDHGTRRRSLSDSGEHLRSDNAEQKVDTKGKTRSVSHGNKISPVLERVKQEEIPDQRRSRSPKRSFIAFSPRRFSKAVRSRSGSRSRSSTPKQSPTSDNSVREENDYPVLTSTRSNPNSVSRTQEEFPETDKKHKSRSAPSTPSGVIDNKPKKSKSLKKKKHSSGRQSYGSSLDRSSNDGTGTHKGSSGKRLPSNKKVGFSTGEYGPLSTCSRAQLEEAGESLTSKLVFAIIQQKIDLFKNLLLQIIPSDSACINDTDRQGNTPLHLAVARNNIEMVKMLVVAQACIDVCNPTGITPLHIAASNNSIEIAEYLINNDVDLNKQSNKCVTPLHLAVHGKHVEMVELLLSRNANKNIKNMGGLIPLELAQRMYENQSDEKVKKIILLLE